MTIHNQNWTGRALPMVTNIGVEGMDVWLRLRVADLPLSSLTPPPAPQPDIHLSISTHIAPVGTDCVRAIWAGNAFRRAAKQIEQKNKEGVAFVVWLTGAIDSDGWIRKPTFHVR